MSSDAARRTAVDAPTPSLRVDSASTDSRVVSPIDRTFDVNTVAPVGSVAFTRPIFVPFTAPASSSSESSPDSSSESTRSSHVVRNETLLDSSRTSDAVASASSSAIRCRAARATLCVRSNSGNFHSLSVTYLSESDCVSTPRRRASFSRARVMILALERTGALGSMGSASRFSFSFSFPSTSAVSGGGVGYTRASIAELPSPSAYAIDRRRRSLAIFSRITRSACVSLPDKSCLSLSP